MMKTVLLLVILALVNAGWNTFNFKDEIEKAKARLVHKSTVKSVRRAAEMNVDAAKKPPAKKPPVKAPVKVSFIFIY